MADDQENTFESGAAGPHLPESELALRWHISKRTLQRWRRDGQGPVYLRLRGYRIRYRLADIVDYERTSRIGGSGG